MTTTTANTQHKLDQFIRGEVIACQTGLVNFILNNCMEMKDAPFTIDDISNMYIFPEYIGEFVHFEGGTEEDRQEEINRLHEAYDLAEDPERNGVLFSDELKELEDLEDEPQEIFEWWLVTPLLANDLEEQGEPVLRDNNGGSYWGRTCTGQSPSMDGPIIRIARNLGVVGENEDV